MMKIMNHPILYAVIADIQVRLAKLIIVRFAVQKWRKNMKWIPILKEYKSYHFRCSSCGQEVKDTEEALGYKYCPYCGEAVDPASEAKFRAPRPDFKVGRKYSGIIRIDLHGTGCWEHDYCTFTCTNVDPLVLETERKDMDGKRYMDKFVYDHDLENAGILSDYYRLVFTKDLEEISNDHD